MLIIAISISTILILISYTLSHKNVYPITFSNVNNENESKSQYECGLEPFEEALGKETRERFYIKFYIIGILFLIFDLETLLIFPASLLFLSNPIISDFSILKSYLVLFLILLILLLGLLYEYRKNIL